jgi:exonuclease VII small subunit
MGRRLPSLALALIVTSSLAPSLARAEGAVTLAAVSGDVRVRPPQSKDYLEAKRGARLEDGARIKTGADGVAELQYDDGSKAVVRIDSEIIVRPKSGERPSGLVLMLGRVWAKIAKSSGGDRSFEVQSANAVAGVRGTDFEVGVGLDGSARVVVSSGEVEVEGEEQRVSVKGGHQVETEQNKLGKVAPQKGDPGWDTWFSTCAKRMESQGLAVAKSLDGRLNRRKGQVEKLVAQQKDLRRQIERLEAQRKRGDDVDDKLETKLAELARVTARLEDMKARLQGAFGLFARWGEACAAGTMPNSKQIGAMASDVAKVAADFADMIEEGTDQSEEGMDELMDDMRKGKTGKPKDSAADELFR